MAPPTDDSGDDEQSLRDRVRDLEDTVSEQQATIQQLMPSRRQTLAGAGLLGAGVLGGYQASGTARAQAAGQVGTSSDRVDVFGNVIDTNTVETDALNNADLENAESETVPTAQGDGTLSMQPTAAEIELVDEGSLPLSVPSGIDAVAVTAVLRDENNDFQIRINDVSSSEYDYQEVDGNTLTSTQDATEFQFARTTSTRAAGGIMHLTALGDVRGNITTSVSGSLEWSSTVAIMTHGDVQGGGNTIDKISSPDRGSNVQGRLFVFAESGDL